MSKLKKTLEAKVFSTVSFMKKKYINSLEGRIVKVPVDRLLLGGENGINAYNYSLMVGDPMRPSRKVIYGPHVDLLKEYQRSGDAFFSENLYKQSKYYQNAKECIEFTGRYFSAYAEEDIISRMKMFVDQVFKNESHDYTKKIGHSGVGTPIILAPIDFSNYYEVVDGNHRIASAIFEGKDFIEASIRFNKVVTPVQDLLSKVLWEGGRKELYQPVDCPELEETWVTVRKSTDRLGMMRKFLDEKGLSANKGISYIDLGASYGWFVHKMSEAGYDSLGIELDVHSIRLGQWVYGLNESSVKRSNIATFFKENDNKFDVVSNFSVLHHFVMGRGGLRPEEYIQHLDKMTRKVLFIETGQGHEDWFKETLHGWDVDFIQKWILSNTSFNEVIPLGKDSDNIGKFRNNYSRTMFACLR